MGRGMTLQEGLPTCFRDEVRGSLQHRPFLKFLQLEIRSMPGGHPSGAREEGALLTKVHPFQVGVSGTGSRLWV